MTNWCSRKKEIDREGSPFGEREETPCINIRAAQKDAIEMKGDRRIWRVVSFMPLSVFYITFLAFLYKWNKPIIISTIIESES